MSRLDACSAALDTLNKRVDAAEFKEHEHPRDEGGKFAAAEHASLKKTVPQLMHFGYRGPAPAKTVKLNSGGSYVQRASPHHWITASTEKNVRGNPTTIPGDKTATGIAYKVNRETKHIHFAELNSHIKGAGRRMVDDVIKRHPDFKFSVTDWSQAGDEDRATQSFWEKMKQKHPGKFSEE